MIEDFEPVQGGMPSALLAEEAILCCFMRYPQRFIAKASAEGIDEDCFYKLKSLYREIIDYASSHPTHDEIDIVLFVQSLELKGTLQRVGGPSTVAQVTCQGPVEMHWSAFALQAKEAKARRIALSASKAISEATTSEDAISEAQAALDALKKAVSPPSRSKSWKESLKAFLSQWKLDFDSENSIPGMPTGFEEIDSISGGMRAGEFWVVCAKSTRGKSVMMLQIAANAINDGKTVAIFSLEMMEAVVAGRLISVLGNVPYGAITQPKTSSKLDLTKIERVFNQTKDAKVWIDDTANQTMAHIEAECQRIKDITGELDLIVIDYMQIVRGEKQRGENREQEVARISMAGKQLAKKFGVPVISASQLNSNGETRESRSLEQDADALLFIADDGIKIGKMRNGKRDDVIRLYLHGDAQKFLNYLPNLPK